MFTRSMSISQAEKGYNKDHLHVPQINLALLCSADTGLPAMIRSIPGSVRDIATLYNSIKEIDAKGKTLILDRGFFSDDTMEFLEGMDMSYILPTRRYSRHYENRIHLNEHFTYHKRLIRCGKKMFDTYKTVLDADKLYLQSDESVFGHVFISFISLYIHCTIENLLNLTSAFLSA